MTGLLMTAAGALTVPTGAEEVAESARRIPVAYDVDVVVVGGTAPGVEAAVAAAQAGSSVFLAAPRPYLGEDICAPKCLWLEPGEKPGTALGRRLFSDSGQVDDGRHPRALPFTYTASLPSAAKHPDRKPPLLTDGAFSSASRESVQYDGDVTVTCDLGEMREVEQVRAIAFYRRADFGLSRVLVATSADGQAWTEDVAAASVAPEGETITATVPIDRRVRYIRFSCARAANTERILLGELELVAPASAQDEAARLEGGAGPVRPMHIKKTLDEALLGAGVQFLYGCYPTDVLKDAQGAPAGIVMANRSGRQAVLAKVIIDATERATVARLAGAQFTSYPAGEHEFKRVVVGGELKEGDGINGRRTGRRFGRSEIIEYTLRLPMRDASFASFAEAHNRAIDLTFDPQQVDASEFLFQVPPDTVLASRQLAGDWPGAERAPLDAFRAAGVDRLFVLGGCAGVPRPVAAKLLRPTAMMPIAARIGQTAAAEAVAAGQLEGVRVGTQAVGLTAADGDVGEFLAGLRSVQQTEATVASPARALPVLGRYDVVVVGGGTGGAPAGIGAGRHGAKALVVEYQYALGGVGTVGMITKYYHGHRDGFTALADAGVRSLASRVWWIGKAEWWRRANREAGTDVWFGCLGTGAFVADGTVRGVVVTTPLGRGVVLAKTVIDSTGNSDVAAAAGARTSYTGADHIAVQGTGLPPIKLGVDYTNTDYTFADDTDVVDFWHQFVCSRGKFSGAYDLGQLIDTRERRRIVGDVTISPMDMILGRTWPDTLSMHKSNFDSHGYTVHPIFLLRPPDRGGMTVYVPLRALVPAGLNGILVTGLGVSAHRDAIPVIRMQPCVQNQGYAAGAVAAEAARHSVTVRDVDLKPVQQHLVKIRCLTESAFERTGRFPLPTARVAEAVRNVSEGHEELAIILSHTETALPLLRQAYGSAQSAEEKLFYAHVCAMLRDSIGAETLAAAIAAADGFDKGWNYRGMGQFGMSISQLDSYIIALGRTRQTSALDPILDKAVLLDARSEFSHHRAVSVALEALVWPESVLSQAARERAAGALAALLDKPGMRGYATGTVDSARKQVDASRTSNVPRNNSLRELVVARALYRCGDRDGKGEAILRQYAADLRGHYARHARAVLDAGGSE